MHGCACRTFYDLPAALQAAAGSLPPSAYPSAGAVSALSLLLLRSIVQAGHILRTSSRTEREELYTKRLRVSWEWCSGPVYIEVSAPSDPSLFRPPMSYNVYNLFMDEFVYKYYTLFIDESVCK